MKYFLILGFMFMGLLTNAQEPFTCQAAKVAPENLNLRKQKLTPNYPGDQNIDVVYQDLNLIISPTTQNLVGEVLTGFKVLTSSNTITLDLNSAFSITGISENNSPLNFTHTNNQIQIQFASILALNSHHTIKINYNGVPVSSGYGSFNFGTHGTNNDSAIWSLSEPYGAPDWWPCKDALTDKVDSSRVSITLPDTYVSVSNGILETENNNGDGTKTYTWFNDIPIAHYLISIACSNYEVYQNTFTYPGQTNSMPVTHYIYPEENTAATKAALDITVDMLQFFSDKFGVYPFYDQKYGHASCEFGGGMEHQTVSSMGGYSRGLVAHELAHQWFGDKITCQTWQDIWLNEGFATFCAALFDEHHLGEVAYDNLIIHHMNSAKNAVGSVYVEDITSVGQIFSGSRSYSKGAVILHMLRGVLGDQAFFDAVHDYINSSMAFGTATTEDLKNSIETSTGEDLDYFFDQWVYSKNNRPIYEYRFTPTGSSSGKIEIWQDLQTADQRSAAGILVDYYEMPIQIEVVYADASSEIMTFLVDNSYHSFTIENLAKEPVSINFDPNNWVFKDAEERQAPLALILETDKENEFVVYPNPAEDYISFKHEFEGIENTSIIDRLGREVSIRKSTNNTISINNLTTGLYYLQLKTKDGSYSKPFIKK